MKRSKISDELRTNQKFLRAQRRAHGSKKAEMEKVYAEFGYMNISELHRYRPKNDIEAFAKAAELEMRNYLLHLSR